MSKTLLRSALIACIALSFRSVTAGAQAGIDVGVLLEGVHEIAAPGLTGSVCAVGPNAVVIAVGGAGRRLASPVVAASRNGSSRAVIFGHTGYLESEGLAAADTGRLVLNALRWAGGAAPRIGVRGLPGLADYLRSHGVVFVSLDGPAGFQNLSETNLIACPTGELNAADERSIAQYLRHGGSLVSSETGWGWREIHPGESLSQHPGNRLLAPYGLLWTDGSVQKTSRAGLLVATAPDPLCQASRALEAIDAFAASGSHLNAAEIAQPVETLTAAVRALPASDRLLRPRLLKLCRSHAGDAALTLASPLTTDNPLDRLVMTLSLNEENNEPAERVRANPAAASFPGLVPADAPRIDRTVRIDTAVPDWHSTGLYAAPGEVVEAGLPAGIGGKGLKLRIGAHTDELWELPKWERAPAISREFSLDHDVTRAANSFGGAIYIDVPDRSRLGVIEVTFHHAVEAPYFVSGLTNLDDWKSRIRNAPAPWAELQGNNIILTVPSSAVRNLDDPEALMAYWDEVSDNCADLYGISRKRRRQERYCSDREISAGYMHSGYPIMTGLDVANRFTDVAELRSRKGILAWGFYHELGHNHQISDWTFEGTGEVTNNLNSLYCCEKLNGVSPDDYGQAHPALAPDAVRKRLAAYLAKGAPFEQWQSDPFLALTMYIELRQAFGWAPFKQVFAEYRRISADQRPTTEIAKHDQWMVRFSHAVGKNLGSFFQAWGVPTSEKARESIASLPSWMPEDFPQK